MIREIFVNFIKILLGKKHQIDKELFRHNMDFPTRLSYASKKIRELYFSLMNINLKKQERKWLIKYRN